MTRGIVVALAVIGLLFSAAHLSGQRDLEADCRAPDRRFVGFGVVVAEGVALRDQPSRTAFPFASLRFRDRVGVYAVSSRADTVVDGHVLVEKRGGGETSDGMSDGISDGISDAAPAAAPCGWAQASAIRQGDARGETGVAERFWIAQPPTPRDAARVSALGGDLFVPLRRLADAHTADGPRRLLVSGAPLDPMATLGWAAPSQLARQAAPLFLRVGTPDDPLRGREPVLRLQRLPDGAFRAETLSPPRCTPGRCQPGERRRRPAPLNRLEVAVTSKLALQALETVGSLLCDASQAGATEAIGIAAPRRLAALYGLSDAAAQDSALSFAEILSAAGAAFGPLADPQISEPAATLAQRIAAFSPAELDAWRLGECRRAAALRAWIEGRDVLGLEALEWRSPARQALAIPRDAYVYDESAALEGAHGAPVFVPARFAPVDLDAWARD